MADHWNRKFVLMQVDDPGSAYFYIYKVADRPEDISDARNVFTDEPERVRKLDYSALPISPPRSWRVALDGYHQPVTMAVYQLRRSP